MFREVIERALRKHVAEEELDETIVEDYIIRNEKDWNELYHKIVPDYLRQELERAGLEDVTLYHLKDDVSLPEYVALGKKGNTPIGVFFEVVHDNQAGETRLYYVRAFITGDQIKTLLPYYHEV